MYVASASGRKTLSTQVTEEGDLEGRYDDGDSGTTTTTNEDGAV